MFDAVKDDGNAVATILSDAGFVTLKRPSNIILKDLTVSKRYYEAPYVVNMAKLKTHVETEITACIKTVLALPIQTRGKRLICPHRSIGYAMQ